MDATSYTTPSTADTFILSCSRLQHLINVVDNSRDTAMGVASKSASGRRPLLYSFTLVSVSTQSLSRRLRMISQHIARQFVTPTIPNCIYLSRLKEKNVFRKVKITYTTYNEFEIKKVQNISSFQIIRCLVLS